MPLAEYSFRIRARPDQIFPQKTFRSSPHNQGGIALARRALTRMMVCKYSRIRFVHLPIKACCLAGLLAAAAALQQAGAQEAKSAATTPDPKLEMKSPRVSSVDVDWNAARAALSDLFPLLSEGGSDGAKANGLARLNQAMHDVFPNISASPIPVLLPFDTAAYLKDKAATNGGAIDRRKYFGGFTASNVFFFPGPAGYDASILLQPQDSGSLQFGKAVDAQISASSVIYELDAPAMPEGTPIRELESQFPGIRRLMLENHLRYTFVRFGVPYVVTIMCTESRHDRRLSCRDADKVGIQFIKTLSIAGGAPQHEPAKISAQTIERPQKISPTFTYYAPGDLLPGTGTHGQAGRADPTVFAKIRFPMAEAPSYVNSQVFLNWGECDFTGRVLLGGSGKGAGYRCKVNSIPLTRDESKNYAYPWRDNFCEHRYFAVSQCPAGLGHQGEDIRPGSCVLRSPDSDRCEPYQHNVVAVRDGVALRDPGDEALYLVINAPGEHIRFRYLHMSPRLLDAAGMVSGRVLSAGEVIGAVDNYQGFEGGTSYHLHLDLQVPTRDGWVFVNPYMTLVAAYERLIGARGVVVNDAMFATASAAAAVPAIDGQAAVSNAQGPIPGPTVALGVVPNAGPSISAAPVHHERSAADEDEEPRSHRHRARTAEHCQTHGARGHRQRHCRTDVAEEREGHHHRHGVRSVDDDVSNEDRGAQHHHRDVHPRHAHRSSRRGRA
jgi:hypothetical protein